MGAPSQAHHFCIENFTRIGQCCKSRAPEGATTFRICKFHDVSWDSPIERNSTNKFVERAQAYPEKRAPDTRRADFLEIGAPFAEDAARAQAGRCSQCGVPYCQSHCPLHNHIPDWLRLTAEGRLQEAYDLSTRTSTMPEICGRICPQDRLCEGNCVIEFSGHGAVTIGSVEKYLGDNAWENGWVRPIEPGTPTGQSVGVIGAGPAGLTAAEYLRRAGHEVDIYDRHDRAGGLLIYGIPNFKLDKSVVDRRVARIEEGGITIHRGVEVGKDVTLAELRERHDAVFVATGVYQSRELTVDGADKDGVVRAIDFLTASNRSGLGDDVAEHADGSLFAKDRDVVVIGGGDTAMDCVRTAIRQGAKSVKCLYRRDRENMPGSRTEVAHAEEEGVEFLWLSGPASIEGGDKAERVQANRMELGEPDADGRRRPVVDPSSSFSLDADLVILALGFEPEPLPAIFGEEGLAVSDWGTLECDDNMMTTLPGVFAGGDIARGASLVVWAVRDGRDVAEKIDTYLVEQRKPSAAAA